VIFLIPFNQQDNMDKIPEILTLLELDQVSDFTYIDVDMNTLEYAYKL
jgi:hypothetical protein